jgi:hypothetical protein
MFKSGFILSTDNHLQAAMFNKTEICVWQQSKILNYGGQIEAIKENSVTINGEGYLKPLANSEFARLRLYFHVLI